MVDRRFPMLALLLGLVAPGQAVEPPERTPEVRVIRLEGRLGPRGPRPAPAAELILDVRGEERQLQVDRVVVLQGSVLGSDVLAEVSPYRPSFRLRGPDAILDRLTKASPGTEVRITGYQRPGSRDLFVSDVTLPAPRSPSSPSRNE